MKVYIVKVSLPASWSDADVLCAVNIGLQDHYHYHANRMASYKALRPVLEQTPHGAVNVLAAVSTSGERAGCMEER